MASVKKKLKRIGAWAWDLFKNSLPSAFMFFAASTGLMLLTMYKKSDVETLDLTWNNTKLLWTIVCVVLSCAYEGFLAFIYGGNQYEMLASGNIRRASGEEYRISAYKESREYRPWKGFAVGGFVGMYTIFMGIYFGCNQAAIEAQTLGTGASLVILLGVFLSGWSILPFFFMNKSGMSVSYFYSCFFAIIPVIISGVFYIIGAYHRRNKAIRAQEIADKSRAELEAKPKKINYGALPGTKPKKRK